MALKHHNLKHHQFHSLRYTSATLLLNSGVNIRKVQERLGHGSPKRHRSIFTVFTKLANRRLAHCSPCSLYSKPLIIPPQCPNSVQDRFRNENTLFSLISENSVFSCILIGGAYGIRTRDPHTARGRKTVSFCFVSLCFARFYTVFLLYRLIRFHSISNHPRPNRVQDASKKTLYNL